MATNSTDPKLPKDAHEMGNRRKLIVAMAEKCEGVIHTSLRAELPDRDLPEALRLSHLLCMCDLIRKNVEKWPETKLHRWLGFIQCGMMANHLLDLDGIKTMFDDAKKVYGPGSEDEDLTDHLDPKSSFNLELGGQG